MDTNSLKKILWMEKIIIQINDYVISFTKRNSANKNIKKKKEMDMGPRQNYCS